jgi:hypothetical protein
MFKKIQIQSVLDTTGHKFVQTYWKKTDSNKPVQITKIQYFGYYEQEGIDDGIEILAPITKG